MALEKSKMITRNEGEQIARAINAVRPDWKTSSLLTLIGDLKDYPLRDLGCALMWVALDKDHAGNFKSATPGRVKEDGPWWEESRNAAEALEAKHKAAGEHAQRMAEVAYRSRQIRECRHCDDWGFFNGMRCRHPLGDMNPDGTLVVAKR